MSHSGPRRLRCARFVRRLRNSRMKRSEGAAVSDDYEVDVVIAGGGVAGSLLTARLGELGYRCMLVEPRGLAAEQSGHSHGFLHRGYIYLRAESDLVAELRDAQQKWQEFLVSPRPVSPHNAKGLVGF